MQIIKCSIVTTAIEKGTDAVTLSKQVSKYLKDFDTLRKDYKEKFGTATDAKDCEYRSIRLARSEINMAYRTAEQTRWRQMDFILGYEIKLSGSHPRTDICDMLAGKYPKDFVWTGWHPNDICYVVPIIATEEEYWQDEDFNPEDCKEYVGDVPDEFKEWVADNAERIEDASQRGTLPYFLKDNSSYIVTAKLLPNYTGFNELDANYLSDNTHSRHLGERGNLAHKPTKHGEQFELIPMKKLKPSSEVLEYTEKQAQSFGAKMKAPMSFEEADKNKANMTKDDENCQSAVVAFYARLLGMDVTAKPYLDGEAFVKLLSDDQTLAYYTNVKDKIHPDKPKTLMSAAEVHDFIENQTAKNGIYNFAINKYSDKEYGHIMCLIKNEGEAYLIDVQKGVKMDIDRELEHAVFLNKDNVKIGVELLRVDKLILSDEALSILKPYS